MNSSLKEFLYKHSGALKNNDLTTVIKTCPPYLKNDLQILLQELKTYQPHMHLAMLFSDAPYSIETGEIFEPVTMKEAADAIEKVLSGIEFKYGKRRSSVGPKGYTFTFIQCHSSFSESFVEEVLVKHLYLNQVINIDYIVYDKNKLTIRTLN